MEQFGSAPQPGSPWTQYDEAVADRADPVAQGRATVLRYTRHQASLIYLNAWDHRLTTGSAYPPRSPGARIGPLVGSGQFWYPLYFLQRLGATDPGFRHRYNEQMRGYPAPVVRDGQATIGSAVISIKNVALDEYINSGANGLVFAGTDLQLDRRVAVKVWPPRMDRSMPDAKRSDQVLAEVRKIARFKDKSIASIYSVDRLQDSGWIYTIMEYIDGIPLVKLRADLDAMRRLFVWHHVFNALDTAERAGAFHGDLHGGNVMVTSFLVMLR